MDKNPLESTNKLLKVIVALLLKRKDPETLTLRQQIEILSDLEMKPLEIAEILGRSNTYVNKELSELRKSWKNKKINLWQKKKRGKIQPMSYSASS